jgi:tetratricopeptide (TPR) repeat protein/anti-sigma regulatory factor (Ser/Thr protein kinase)
MYMRPIMRYLLVLLLLCDLSKAQDQEIRSYKNKLANATNDSLKMDAYWELGMTFRPIDQAIARRYIDSVLQIAMQYEKANKKLLEYHILYKATALTTLANVEIDNENLDESIKLHLQCVKLYEEINYPGLVATSLSNIGAIFVMANKFDDAVNYLKRSVAVELRELKRYPGNKDVMLVLAPSYLNLGDVYSNIPDVDSSIHYYNKALQIYSTYKDDDGVAFCYNGLTKAYRLKKDFTKAIVYCSKAIDMFRGMNNEREMAPGYNNFSDIYLDMKNYAKALLYADSAEKICMKNGFNENRVYAYKLKALAYEQLGDVKNQLKYYQRSTDLRDSLNSVNSLIAIEELKTKYETEKKEQSIEKLKKDNEIQSLQANRLIIIIIAIAVVACLLIWLAIFLQRTIKQRKEAYIKLQEKNIEIQKQGELLSEQSKLISRYQSQMNPHFIFNALNSIQGFVVNDEKQKTMDQLQLFSKLMRQTLSNSNDEQIPLDTEINYLKTYIQFEQNRFNDPLQFVVNQPEDADGILMPPMMIQPFVENCIKHAGFQTMKNARIDLTITTEDKLLKVVVKDNGLGFDQGNEEIFKRSHAVSMIRSRLVILFKAAGMEFTSDYFNVRSKPVMEKGTEVIFYLPLNYKY